MSNGRPGSIHSASDGGVVGKHPDEDQSEFLVAPSLADEFNTARLRLIPIACFAIKDVRFKFDSSFVLPEVQADMANFANLRKDDPRVIDAPISIFGHADPSYMGNFEPNGQYAQVGDDYNKTLSGRRAIAIYALLVRDASLWNDLYTHHLGHDVWGEDAVRTMLEQTDPGNFPAQQGQTQTGSGPSSQTSSDSAKDSRVRDIANDTSQRQQLFLQYMNLLCGDLKLDKNTDFLARGAGKDLKGDVQGCSRFNPLVLFSSEDEARFKKAFAKKDEDTLHDDRDARNSVNRRVMILVFRKGSQTLPAKWPCPTYKEGGAGCKKRFWYHGDKRRSTHDPTEERKFEDTHDTFACRFYQRLSDRSPCEKLFPLVLLRIRLIDNRFINDKDQPFDGLQYQLDVLEFHFTGVTTKDGVVEHLIPAAATTAVLTLMTKSKDGNPAVFWKLNLEIVSALAAPTTAEGAQARLNNLGFFAGQTITGSLDDVTVRAIQRFQTFYKIKGSDGKQEFLGDLDGPTTDKMKEVYGV